ncbi:TIGR03943 family putative permease subunit [Peptostreptococcus equinus]|uniref:TIGR03943 family protein n=1 Tax=Peptostreptococcus equinus TaxID=3003601 RepID=A0ABY7JNC9_9FIRM|nr:TIGR03943 family protein [Peptostreptococcus sp. CBA3647]WAW14874.1 TIGR03943 family protein [Peptostreptococcus sp. CBA3647]
MFKRINLEMLIQGLIELSLAIAILFAIESKKINSFVHPKFNGLLLISSIFLIFLSYMSFKSMEKAKHINNIATYFVLAIPLICTFYINDNAFKFSQNIENTSIKISTKNNNKNVDIQKTNKKLYVAKDGKDYIDVNDDMYVKWYYETVFNLEPYKDVEFKFLVRVFKDSSQNEKFIVLGRLGMVCCMADLQPCGFIYKDSGFEKLQNNQWYLVKGKIKDNHDITYNLETLPIMYDVEFERVKKPKDEYVYLR